MQPEDKVTVLENKVKELEQKLSNFMNPATMSEDFLSVLVSKGFMRVIGGFGYNGSTGREFKNLFVEHNTVPTAGFNTNKSLIYADYMEYYVPFTASTSDTCTASNHGFNDGDNVYVYSTGNLPSPLSSSIGYYIINSATNTFKLSLTPGGAAINITDVGAGRHYITTI